jgi:hypothetical protein
MSPENVSALERRKLSSHERGRAGAFQPAPQSRDSHRSLIKNAVFEPEMPFFGQKMHGGMACAVH